MPNILKSFDYGYLVRVVFLDISKALDKSGTKALYSNFKRMEYCLTY